MQRYHDSDHLLVVSGGSGAGWCLPFIDQIAKHRLILADEEQGRVVRGNEAVATKRPDNRSSSSRPLSMRVILATRDTSCRTWFLRAVSELLSKYSENDSSSNVDIQVNVYLTENAMQPTDLENNLTQDPASKGSASSANENNIREKGHNIDVLEREFEGRPQLPQIIQEAVSVAEAGQSLSVFVCGPKTMQNDVRNAVAKENRKIVRGSKVNSVYLHTEHFSWA